MNSGTGERPDSTAHPLIPRPHAASVAIAAPGAGPGYWAGAPSAVATEEGVYLAYKDPVIQFH